MTARPKPARPPLSGLATLAEPVGTLMDLGLVALALLALVNAWAPPQDLPWKPLRLADPPGLATDLKFARAAADPLMCRAVLREGGVGFAEAPERPGADCPTPDAVRLSRSTLSPAGPVMTCPVALGYAFWLRHAVQPAARETLGAEVTAVRHYGTYACRNVYGRTAGRRSEHATANALDVAAFETAGGRRVSVAGDYRRDDARGVFVRRAGEGACRWFKVVLGPDYNAAHRDHFHLDQGGYRACR